MMANTPLRIRFAWDSMFARLRVTAVDEHAAPLAQMVVELTTHVRAAVAVNRGSSWRHQIEDLTAARLREIMSLAR
jgi:hypothetical protein